MMTPERDELTGQWRPPRHVPGQLALVATPVCRHDDGSEHPAPDQRIGAHTFPGVCDQDGARLRWRVDVDDEDDPR
jgi:hypothetical protein